MPKMKTSKTIAKRFKVTRTGKILKRAAGQDHFNSKETGQQGRAKRLDVVVSQRLRRFMRTAMPHS